MPIVDIINLEKQKVGTIELKEEIFNIDVNMALVHQVLKAQLAGLRRGTAKTKTRGEVRGGGRKPFRQKGTGRSRQGSIRSPLHPKGGQSFGPIPRTYAQRTPKKMIKGAMYCLLSDRFKAGRLLVVDTFELEEIRTKRLNQILRKQLELDKVLIVDRQNQKLELSGRNLPHVKVLRTEGLNVYDLLRSEWVVFTQQAVQWIHERVEKGVEDAV